MANNRRASAKPKSAIPKAEQSAHGPKASEEFGGEIYASDDWKRLKKKHPGGFQARIVDLVKKIWDDGTKTWYAQLEGHTKLAKISRPSGRSLAESFGDPMPGWKDRLVHVTPTNYNTGWGCVMDPVEDDDDVVVGIDEEEESID